MKQQPQTIDDETKDHFDAVPFVNTMSHSSLKIKVRTLWNNLHTLGNHIEKNRKDICYALDHILDGNKPNVDDITQTKRFVLIDGNVVEYDSLNDSFKVFNRQNLTMSEEIKALNYEQIKNNLFK